MGIGRGGSWIGGRGGGSGLSTGLPSGFGFPGWPPIGWLRSQPLSKATLINHLSAGYVCVDRARYETNSALNFREARRRRPQT